MYVFTAGSKWGHLQLGMDAPHETQHLQRKESNGYGYAPFRNLLIPYVCISSERSLLLS